LEEGDIASLPSFNFYIRISAMRIQETFSGETLVPVADRDAKRSKAIIDLSRQNYAVEFSTDQSALKLEGARKRTMKPTAVDNLELPS
jgi:hypothetical protein